MPGEGKAYRFTDESLKLTKLGDSPDQDITVFFHFIR